MRFVLHYRGQLKSNGSPAHKHEIRKVFHRQLRRLWLQQPLSDCVAYLEPRERQGDYSMLRDFGGFHFVPLVCEHMNVVVRLNLTVLRPEPPGKLITQGGDLDNRIKTLFDALTIPRHLNAIPAGEVQTEDFLPHFHCLLEDDNLVTSVSIKTEQLLEEVASPSEIEALIEVETFVTRQTLGNVNWA